MFTRMRLVKGATALLYLGPLIAGLCGFGWTMLAPFIAIFVVWLMVLRPEQWPSSPEEWLTGSALLAALAQVLSQIVLVAALFGIGSGLGGLAGIDAVGVNPILPVSISFIAIPLCRMLWDSREAASLGYFLDEEAESAHAENAVGLAATAIIPLLNLPDTAPDAEVTEAVAAVLDVPTAELRLDALTAALAKPDRSHAALRRGLLLWATEPEIVAPGQVPGSMAKAFAIANGDLDLLRLYVPRAMALIAAFPNRATDFPTPAELRAAAAAAPDSDLPAHLQADLRDGLRALARAVAAATGTAAEVDDLPAPREPVPFRQRRTRRA
ncbi:hypothetical protein [Rhodobacter calidifons]|uniref:Uncharacterized protein n=1 Tax=Rhodobacter calidifons TaxID=2715277 RepID=A0ABX0G4E7_9RHOB|nr:hypothetical protein [Rhodobacter calidifons]NHB75783.1 hypothetical protein [Rhodobacter calidifons]